MIKIISKKLEEITPYENNPRHNDEAVDFVANSIKEFGFKSPIIVDKNGVIIAGHTRYKASLKLGLEEVPVVVAEDLTEEQAKALRLADNKAAEIAEWDIDLLDIELDGIKDIDMSLFGFNVDIPEGEKEAEEDNFDIDQEVETRTQPGQIWKLGRHKLMCADSTDPKNIEKLMAGELADLLITDPPYNVDYVGKTKDALKIQNDKMEDSEFYNFLLDAFTAVHEALKKGGAFYIWHADSNGYEFRKACREADLEVKQCLIWNKNTMVMGRQDYQWKHEPCLYGWKQGAAHYFIDDRTQTTVIEDKGIDFNKLKKAEAIELLKKIYSDKVSSTIINEDKPAVSDLHPTMKPIKLLARLVKNSSKPDELVIDTFGGSGSTLITCEQLGRRCNTMELDPKYCDVILARWEAYTGKTAELLEEGQ